MRRVPESLRADAAEEFLLLEEKPGIVLKDVRGVVGRSRAVDIKVANDKDCWEKRCCRRSLRAVIFFELSRILVEHDLSGVRVPALVAGTSFLLTSFEAASLGPPLPPEPPPPKDEQWVPTGYGDGQEGFGTILMKAGFVLAAGVLIGGMSTMMPMLMKAFGMLGSLFMKAGALMASMLRTMAECMAENGLGCIIIGVKALMALIGEGALWLLEALGRFNLWILEGLWWLIKEGVLLLGSGLGKLAVWVWKNLDNAFLLLLRAWWGFVKFYVKWFIVKPIIWGWNAMVFVLANLPDALVVLWKGIKWLIGGLFSGILGPLIMAIGDILNFDISIKIPNLLKGAFGWLGNALVEGTTWIAGALAQALPEGLPGFLEMILSSGLHMGKYLLAHWADMDWPDWQLFGPISIKRMLVTLLDGAADVIDGAFHLAGKLLKLLGRATWNLLIFMGEMTLKILEGFGDLLMNAPSVLVSGAKLLAEGTWAVLKGGWGAMSWLGEHILGPGLLLLGRGLLGIFKLYGRFLWWMTKGIFNAYVAVGSFLGSVMEAIFLAAKFAALQGFLELADAFKKLKNFSLDDLVPSINLEAMVPDFIKKVPWKKIGSMFEEFFGAVGTLIAAMWNKLKKIKIQLNLDCHGTADCFLLIMDMIFFVMIVMILGSALLEPKIYTKPGWEYDEMDPAELGKSERGGREHPHFTEPVEEEESGDWIQQGVKKPKDGIVHEKELEDRPPEMFRGPVKAAWETKPGAVQLTKEIDDEAMMTDGILESDFWRCHPGLDHIQYNMHPVIKFRDPIDKVRVTLTDEDTQEVHWANAYKLAKPGVLDQNAIILDGSAPAFKRICPDPNDLNGHTFELKATRYPPLNPGVNEAEEENEIATVYYKAWRVKDPDAPKATSALQVLSWPPPYPRPGVPTGVPRMRPGGVRGRDYIMNLPPSSGAILGASLDSYKRHSRAHEHSQFLSSADIVVATSGASVHSAQAPALARTQPTTFHTMAPQPHQAMQIWEAAQAQQQLLWKYLHIPASPKACWRTFALARMAYRYRKKATEFFAPAPARSEQDDTTAASAPF